MKIKLAHDSTTQRNLLYILVYNHPEFMCVCVCVCIYIYIIVTTTTTYIFIS